VSGGPVGLGTGGVLLATGDTTSPSVGSAAAGSIGHPPAVDDGQGRGVTTGGEYADKANGLGVSVAHCAFRFEKSGSTGFGDPCRGKLYDYILEGVPSTGRYNRVSNLPVNDSIPLIHAISLK
jgi:hypothetical protein